MTTPQPLTECGAIPLNVRGPVPCHLPPGHDGQHFSTSGCAGSEIRWTSTPQPLTGDELAAIKAWVRSPIPSFRSRQDFIERTRVDVVPRLVAEVESLREKLAQAAHDNCGCLGLREEDYR